MESPRKFNDCYFYYYSTCTKGDNCVFRHEPSALGCETMCSLWQQGKCLDKRCKLRHMELRKNRKQIPCYWENQPGGCRKKHCPFMHKNPDARTDGIAPSHPVPLQPVSAAGMGVPAMGEAVGEPLPGVGGVGGVAGVGGVPAAAPAPVSMLWQHQQQQRQVVLDSAILGVLPGGGELLGARRVLGVEPYPLPVDPLVVNFEEESDNESAPAATPTKHDVEDQSLELRLLDQIQAEAAAYYGYAAPPAPLAPLAPLAPHRQYDRLSSLDDIAGNKKPPTAERRKSLDFKILSLEEIRARKKAETTQATTISLNLSRKRKSSTHETVTSSGNKIIKVVRSNSIVYKKVDPNAAAVATDPPKADPKQTDNAESRKRTLSEVSDAYEIQADELVDNFYEFKRIKVSENKSKPKLIRNRSITLEKSSTEANSNQTDVSNKEDNESDSEVQIVSVDMIDNTNADLSDCDVIDVDSMKAVEQVDIVDLSDDDDVTITGSDLAKNVPDVVASCRKKVDSVDKDFLKDINTVLCEDTLRNIDAILNDDSNDIEDDL